MVCSWLVFSVLGRRLYSSSILHHYNEDEYFHEGAMVLMVFFHFLFISCTNVPPLSISKVEKLINEFMNGKYIWAFVESNRSLVEL